MKTKNGTVLSKKQIFGYAMGDLGGCMTFAIMGSFLLPYYTEVAGISSGAVAIMFFVLKIWDAINDPMMGAIMDKMFAKTHNKHGKFRPWMMRSTPLLLITSIMMFTMPSFTSGMASLVVAYVTYLLYEASYTMFNIPYGSLLSAMAGTEGERATLSSARGFGSMIGNLLPMALFPVIISATTANPKMGYAVGVTICAVIGLIACLMSCKFTHESQTKMVADPNAASDDIKFSDILVVIKKNRAFVGISLAGLGSTIAQYTGATLGVYMYRDVLGALPLMGITTILGMGLSFVVLTLAPKCIKKFGLDKTVQTSLLLAMALFVCQFIASFIGAIPYMIMASLASLCSSLPILMQWGMVGDAIDYNEMLTGKRTEGSIYGTFNLSRRFGQAIGSSFAALMLGVIAFVPNAPTQTQGALMGIKILVVGVPFLAAILSFVALKYVWNITPAVREQMAAHRAAKEAASDDSTQ